MPEMDGIECFQAMRSQVGGLNTETPVVILTANAGRENQEYYKREGVDGYLLKPVSGRQLESELLRHLPRELVSLANVQKFTDIVMEPVLGKVKKALDLPLGSGYIIMKKSLNRKGLLMKIKDVEKLTGLTAKSIRYYESKM